MSRSTESGSAIIDTYRPSRAHEALGPAFFDPVEAAEFPETILRYRNQRAAESIGLGDMHDKAWVGHFGQMMPLAGSFETPLALRYHGHQFQSYNPDLGDGRGFLLAQFYGTDGRLMDIGTKGSGQTPWSRGGDGRLTLKGGVREVLATSMLEALGVNTSKSLSLIETGESLFRNDEPSPTRSSVLVRLSHSHIRIGTFQRLAFNKDVANLGKLLAHCVTHYWPDTKRESEAETAAAFLEAVSGAVAKTGAEWIAAGFVHGVLNSDNINITGESFDYGPWRFVPTYDVGFTAAYFDRSGLYAFGAQPDALAWNLTRLAESLLPIGDRQSLEVALNVFGDAFRVALPRAFLRRLGLEPAGQDADAYFATALIGFLHAAQPAFEQAFFDLRGGVGNGDSDRLRRSPIAEAYAHAAFAPLKEALSGYEVRADAHLDHAYFARATPRTMLIEEMEAIWAPIAERDDWSGFEAALADIAEMRDAYSETGARS